MKKKVNKQKRRSQMKIKQKTLNNNAVKETVKKEDREYVEIFGPKSAVPGEAPLEIISVPKCCPKIYGKIKKSCV